jgi:glutathione S-transferase
VIRSVTQHLPGVIARTVSGVSLYAALGTGNNINNNKGDNPTVTFSSMIGNMASSMFGKNEAVEYDPIVDQQLAQMNIPSWESVRTQLEKQQTAEEKSFRADLMKGYGIGSPLHSIRLYDDSNKVEDIRVTFYRDSASWCPYCQKVWITLEEKKIPYRIEKVNMRCYGEKPMTFQMMQPSGQIPVAFIDGTIYRQSNDILSVLEESFPNHKSLSASTAHEGHAQSLLRLERQLFSAWMSWLTSGSGPRYRESFVQVLQLVEQALSSSDGPFFLGNDISIVDVQFAPFLERIAASLLYYKGFQIRVAPNETTTYPAVNRWFDAMEQLPSYQLTKSDYYTHCWDLPPQLGGCVKEPAGKVYERAINGEGSWELPIVPHNGGIEPDWIWAGDDAASQREAVERLSANHEAIIKFASRGAGKKGIPPVSAPLADPNAISNAAVQSTVSAILRVVCFAMLDGSTAKHDATIGTIRQTMVANGGSEYTNGVVSSLAYLRDRIGVPRDMKLGAAQHLRAYLNWAIEILLVGQDT